MSKNRLTEEVSVESLKENITSMLSTTNTMEELFETLVLHLPHIQAVLDKNKINVLSRTHRLITNEDLEVFQDDQDILWRLQAAGVDNWEGYEEAMSM